MQTSNPEEEDDFEDDENYLDDEAEDAYAAKRRECKRAFAARKYARVKASRRKQAS